MSIDTILEAAARLDPLPDLMLIADNDSNIANIKNPLKKASATISAYRKLFPKQTIAKSAIDRLIVAMK